MRTTRSLAAVAAALIALAAAPAAARAADFVGLGDSYAAGPLIPVQSLFPLGCLRSSRNYAHIAAGSRTLADVSCSGAKTNHMTDAQSTSVGTNPPQFDALSAATKIVSLQIGGNDIGFSEILENCATANPFGSPCRTRYTAGGVDQISNRIQATAGKVAAVIQGIHQRSPAARVLVVNYAAILPRTGFGCWPQAPFAFNDVGYLRAKQLELNAMLAEQAGANGARIVDAYTASLGKDSCRLPDVRWVEPLVPVNAAAPFHPNARGEAGVAAAITSVLAAG